MFRQKIMIATAFLLALTFCFPASSFAFGKKVKKQAKFKVRIENISAAEGLAAEDGSKYPFALSPGMFVITKNKSDFFKAGKKAKTGIEAQAEDGNPEILAKKLSTRIGSINTGIFNTPLGTEKPAPILPGQVYEFEFMATEGAKINVIAMYGQSNDLFYAPKNAIDLFVGGKALSGDLTEKFLLWDAGTEVNEPLGIGKDQAPRQSAPNTGKAENGIIRLANNSVASNIASKQGAISFIESGSTLFPATKDVLRVTITAQ